MWLPPPLPRTFKACLRDLSSAKPETRASAASDLVRHGRSDGQAALFFGTLWKLRIIERPEQWVGVRTTDDNPTFPNRGINLAGKTYFLADRS